MKGISGVIIKAYSILLQLYPASFRNEFKEQMLLDFSDTVADARERGKLSLVLLCLRELVDFPGNLVRIHWKEDRVFKILRSQPVNIGLRGAVGFGVTFAVANIISMFVALKLAFPDDSIVGHLQVFYFDLFHTEHGLELISWVPSALSSLFAGLVSGILFAFLFADRAKFSRYTFTGMLGWFLHDVVRNILSYCFNLPVFLSANEYTYFSSMTLILSGAFLGLILIVAKSERREPVRLMVQGAIAYPLITYLYTKQVFNFLIFTTPWRFISLTFLMVTFIAGVFAIAIKIDSERKMLWVVLAGAVGYPLMSYFVFFVGQFIYPPMPSWGILHDEFIFWPLELSIAASNAIHGTFFGLLLGLVLGFQKKNNLAEKFV